MAKVSIIVPIYNSSKYLKKCLDSITEQTLEDIEIILVNDGSTDNSINIIKEYEKNDSRIKVIDLGENKGPGYARNIGIGFSNSKYIGFVDSDDYIAPDMYKKLYIGSERNSADIACCDHTCLLYGIDYRKTEETSKEKEVIKPKVSTYHISRINVECWNKLFRHDFIDNFYFDEDIKYEDYPFTVKAVGSAEKIYCLHRNYYYHRIRLDSISHEEYKKLDISLLDIFKCNDRIRDYFIENGLIGIYHHGLNNLFIVHSMGHCSNLLTVNMNKKDKKELINYYIKYVELEYGDIFSNKGYLDQKDNSTFFDKKMSIIENRYLDQSCVETDNKDEIMQNIKRLILENYRIK